MFQIYFLNFSSKVKLSKHELDTKTHEIEELEHNLEKSKRDYTCLWQNYEVKANQLSVSVVCWRDV